MSMPGLRYFEFDLDVAGNAQNGRLLLEDPTYAFKQIALAASLNVKLDLSERDSLRPRAAVSRGRWATAEPTIGNPPKDGACARLQLFPEAARRSFLSSAGPSAWKWIVRAMKVDARGRRVADAIKQRLYDGPAWAGREWSSYQRAVLGRDQ